ncbi:MAG: hypothetical protein ACYDBQ_04455 [Thermoplasmatota archaeon]
MRRAAALAIVLALAALSWGTLRMGTLPWVALPLAALSAASVAVAPRRRFVLLLLLFPPAFYGLLALLTTRRLDAALETAVGGWRLGVAVCVNVAALERVGAERLLEGLRLPRTATAWLAAVLVAGHDVARDWESLQNARKLEGTWPTGARRVAAAAALIPALMALAVARATTRRDALRLAGHDTPNGFVPIVAVAALIVADRIALAALPNVKLSYVVLFVAGIVFGPGAAFVAGLVGLSLSDFLLTGLDPLPYLQAFAVAWIGLLGGWMRPWSRHFGSHAWTVALAAIGVAATLAFSVLSDLIGFAASPELAAHPSLLGVVIGSGLVFNLVPAAANGALFAVAVAPSVRRIEGAGGRRTSTPVPS